MLSIFGGLYREVYREACIHARRGTSSMHQAVSRAEARRSQDRTADGQRPGEHMVNPLFSRSASLMK